MTCVKFVTTESVTGNHTKVENNGILHFRDKRKECACAHVGGHSNQLLVENFLADIHTRNLNIIGPAVLKIREEGVRSIHIFWTVVRFIFTFLYCVQFSFHGCEFYSIYISSGAGATHIFPAPAPAPAPRRIFFRLRLRLRLRVK